MAAATMWEAPGRLAGVSGVGWSASKYLRLAILRQRSMRWKHGTELVRLGRSVRADAE